MIINFFFTKAIAFIYLFGSCVEGQGDAGIDFFARVSSKTEPNSLASTPGALVLSEEFDHKNWLSLGGLSYSHETKNLDAMNENNSSQLKEHSKLAKNYNYAPLEPSFKSSAKIYENFNHSCDTNPQLQQLIKDQYFDNESRLRIDDKSSLNSRSYTQTKFYDSPLSSNKYNEIHHVKPISSTAMDGRLELLGKNVNFYRKAQKVNYNHVQDNYDFHSAASFYTSRTSEPYPSNQKECLNVAKIKGLSLIQKSDGDETSKKLIPQGRNFHPQDSKKTTKKLIDPWNNLNNYDGEGRKRIRKGTKYEVFKPYCTSKNFKHAINVRDGRSTTEKLLEQKSSLLGGKSSHRGTKRKMLVDMSQEINSKKELATNHRRMDLENETAPQEQIEYAFKRLIGQENLPSLLALFKLLLAMEHVESKTENFGDLKLKLDSMKFSGIITELFQKQKDLPKHLARKKISNKASVKLDLITNSFMGKLWVSENIHENKTMFSQDQTNFFKEKWLGNELQISDTELMKILKKYHDLKKMFKSRVAKRDRLMTWLLVELWIGCFFLPK
ncbi:hypothetical protein PPACK8108_LOCUS25257 [Phakopsora pachyrhizi]|uniref:Uncharacterized protein n=1 Tax=Phakopsora pachyrhizi TaxID=170000 RepID=A0AAV0BUP1_PHAPC|nr:hypothetical protein PPACK8108_LOCUS25257 [Phakopsora pachyrhizi]